MKLDLDELHEGIAAMVRALGSAINAAVLLTVLAYVAGWLSVAVWALVAFHCIGLIASLINAGVALGKATSRA